MSPTPPRKLDHVPQLDGLRGLACLMVMFGHSEIFADALYALARSAGLESRAPVSLFWFASTGVRIFFVLSGFLITRIILSDRGSHPSRAWGAFWLRRASRIFPAYYLALAITAHFYPDDHWWPHILYLTDFGGNGTFTHSWSLAVEEQFYLFWPLACFFLPTLWSRGIAILAIPASLGAGIYLTCTIGVSGAAYIRPEPNVVLLMAGALMAYHETAIRPSGRRAKLIAASLPLIAGLLYLAMVGLLPSTAEMLIIAEYLRDTCLAVAVVLYLLVAPPAVIAVLSRQPLVYIGRISYGLYLWHVPVFKFLYDSLHLSEPAMTALQWSTAFAVAMLSYHLYERPIMAWVRTRLSPRPRLAAVEAPLAKDTPAS